MIDNQKIDFAMVKKTANLENLRQAFIKKPTIIHIACHGEDYLYYETLNPTDEQKSNLRIEHDQKIGLEILFKKSHIDKELIPHSCLNERNYDGGIKLLFVNACQSKRISTYI